MVAPQRQLATIAARKSAPSAGYSANANPEDDTEGTVRPAFQSTRMPEERSLFVCTLSRTHSPLPATSITFSRDPFLLAHVAHVNGRAANAARHQGCAETRGETFISIHPDARHNVSSLQDAFITPLLCTLHRVLVLVLILILSRSFSLGACYGCRRLHRENSLPPRLPGKVRHRRGTAQTTTPRMMLRTLQIHQYQMERMMVK